MEKCTLTRLIKIVVLCAIILVLDNFCLPELLTSRLCVMASTYLILLDIAEQGPQRPSDQLPESCCEPKLLLYILHRTHFQQLKLLFSNFRIKYVDWLRIIVQARRLGNDRYRTKNTGQRKQP